MTTITIYPQLVKGKYSVEVSDSTVLSGKGITKDKYCGSLNQYWASKAAIKSLSTLFAIKEIGFVLWD